MTSSIELSYVELQDTLVERGLVSTDWFDEYQDLRQTLSELYEALPRDHEKIAKLKRAKPTVQDVNYFDCNIVLKALLESPDNAATNLLGQYTSPLTRQWDALVHRYEKKNLFAAEAARILIRNGAFELPHIRTMINENDKQIGHAKRKMEELQRRILNYQNQYKQKCETFGIQGTDVRSELQNASESLSPLLNEVAGALSSDSIAKAIWYYEALQSYLHSYVTPETKVSAPSECFPTLQMFQVSATSTKDSSIRSNGSITDASTMLLQQDLRAILRNELLELQAFLKQRRAEILNETDMVAVDQVQDTKTVLEYQSLEQLDSYLAEVQSVLTTLSGRRLQQLLFLKNSPGYLGRHVQLLENFHQLQAKCNDEISKLSDTSKKLGDVNDELRRQQSKVSSDTKRVKNALEAAMPALFKGSQVTIIGDINDL